MFPVCARLSCSHYPSVLQFVPIYTTVDSLYPFVQQSVPVCPKVLASIYSGLCPSDPQAVPVCPAFIVFLSCTLCPCVLHSLPVSPAVIVCPNVFACLSPTLCPPILHSVSVCSRLCQSHDPVYVCLTIGLPSICPEVFVKTPSVQHVQSVFVCPALSARLSCSL